MTVRLAFLCVPPGQGSAAAAPSPQSAQHTRIKLPVSKATATVASLMADPAQYPSVQSMQAVEPGESWKVPATQLAHTGCVVVAANEPGAHTVGTVTPVPHAFPAGQSLHSLALASPGVLEYVPATHGSAAAAPSAQKSPAVHAMQLVEPGES